MLTKKSDHDRLSYEFLCLEECVPADHLLRKIDQYIDFSFIYDLVEPLYSPHHGRPSLDPVLLIKIPILQVLFGIPSMRRTMEEIKVNMAYRWFLGLGFTSEVPHFSTFGKNYTRRFKGTDLFEQIFERILLLIIQANLVETSVLFVDSTPVKAHANRNKKLKVQLKRETKAYEEKLYREMNEKREEDGMDPFDDSDADEEQKMVERSVSPQDPEAGLFVKGEHRREFAYSLQVACDEHGWILAYDVCAGNEHDSRSFHELYPQVSSLEPTHLVMDAGYKTPVIAQLLQEDDVQAVFPYTAPKGKKKEKGFRKRDFLYDGEKKLYHCPQGETLTYKRVDREGYLSFEAPASRCQSCPDQKKCLSPTAKSRRITRHLYEDSLDEANRYRLTEEGKDLYAKRKQTIERVFAEGKENHGLRFTRQVGREAMKVKASLTLLCMNMKKYALLIDKRVKAGGKPPSFKAFFRSFLKKVIPSRKEYLLGMT